jgi:hypothetical protein
VDTRVKNTLKSIAFVLVVGAISILGQIKNAAAVSYSWTAVKSGNLTAYFCKIYQGSSYTVVKNYYKNNGTSYAAGVTFAITDSSKTRVLLNLNNPNEAYPGRTSAVASGTYYTVVQPYFTGVAIRNCY